MPAVTFFDRVFAATVTTGTGAITPGAAVGPFLTFGAVPAGSVFPYLLTEGANWEQGLGTMNADGTITRAIRRSTATNNGPIALAGNGQIAIMAAAADLPCLSSSLTQAFQGPVTAPTLVAITNASVGILRSAGSVRVEGAGVPPGATGPGIETSFYSGVGILNSYDRSGNGFLPLSLQGSTIAIAPSGSNVLTVSAGTVAVTGSFTASSAAISGAASVGGTSTLRTFNIMGNGGIGSGAPGLGFLNDGLTATDSHGAIIVPTNSGNSLRGFMQVNGSTIRFNPMDVEAARFAQSGNLLLKYTSDPGWHAVNNPVAQGSSIWGAFSTSAGGGTGYDTVRFYAAGQALSTSTACAAAFGSNTSTGRSINSVGTINASGADYAEYMTKADGCSTIAKGDVCGVDGEGKLTHRFDDALSFVIKSTDPNLVGGDTWTTHLAPRPEAPGPLRDEPLTETALPVPELRARPSPVEEVDEPSEEPAGESAAAAAWQEQRVAFALFNAWKLDDDQWRQESARHDEAVLQRADHDAACEADHAAWVVEAAEHAAAIADYEAALPTWQADYEAARVLVDRISFCGQVPANLAGTFAVGDYVVPHRADDGTIAAAAIPDASINFDQYRRRIGRVWAIRNGRAWVDVQHG